MESESPILFDYSLSERDYARCVLERNLGKNLAIPLACGIAVSLYSIVSGGFYGFLIWLYALTPLFVMALGGALALLIDRIAVRLEFRSNRVLNSGDFHYSIRLDGIEQTSEASGSFIAVDKIYKLRETRSFMLVYLSRRLALMFPKRVLGEAGLARLRSFGERLRSS